MEKIILFAALVLALVVSGACGSVQVDQNCTMKVRSKCGTPMTCESDGPLPLSMKTVVKLNEKIKWGGSGSWKFGIEDVKGNLTPLTNGCISGQPQPAEYGSGSNFTLTFVCSSLPRELKKGDKLWIFVFSDKDNPDLWLMFNIPIQGITNLATSSEQYPLQHKTSQKHRNYPNTLKLSLQSQSTSHLLSEQ